MEHKVFLDTDVIIDFLTDRQPFANASSRIFELGESNQLTLFISAISVVNTYFVIRKFLGHKKTMNIINELVEITKIVGTGQKEIISAIQSGFKDFEDGVQHSTALTIKKVEAIITRNTKDFTNSNIAVFTPENYLKMINDGS